MSDPAITNLTNLIKLWIIVIMIITVSISVATSLILVSVLHNQ